MYRVISRLLIVILVAGLIAGGAILFSRSSYAASLSDSSGRGGFEGGRHGGFSPEDGLRPEGERLSRHSAGSLEQGLPQVIITLSQTALVFTLFILGQKLWASLKSMTRKNPAPA